MEHIMNTEIKSYGDAPEQVERILLYHMSFLDRANRMMFETRDDYMTVGTSLFFDVCGAAKRKLPEMAEVYCQEMLRGCE